jgi:hypothetical protein
MKKKLNLATYIAVTIIIVIIGVVIAIFVKNQNNKKNKYKNTNDLGKFSFDCDKKLGKCSLVNKPPGNGRYSNENDCKSKCKKPILKKWICNDATGNCTENSKGTHNTEADCKIKCKAPIDCVSYTTEDLCKGNKDKYNEPYGCTWDGKDCNNSKTICYSIDGSKVADCQKSKDCNNTEGCFKRRSDYDSTKKCCSRIIDNIATCNSHTKEEDCSGDAKCSWQNVCSYPTGKQFDYKCCNVDQGGDCLDGPGDQKECNSGADGLCNWTVNAFPLNCPTKN